MNPECRSYPVHASPRRQQPRQTISPRECAAGGDSPCDQVLADRSLVTPTEIFAMKTSLLTTVTKDDSRAKSKLNNPFIPRNVGQIFCVSNDSSQIQENVIVSMTDKDATPIRYRSDIKLAENNDEKSRFTSKSLIIENNLNCHIALKRELPCKEYSHENPQAGNHEYFTDNERTTFLHSELTRVIAPNGEDIQLRKINEDYSGQNIFFPDRKISMFSKEIWTEKVLPIDTYVCPEPELVEIYCDKKKITDQFNRFEEYSTESIDSSVTRRGSNRGVLGRNISITSSLSARKNRTSSSGQKKINFDDEIWPICPQLIPSGKELSISILKDTHEVIPPEKLNEHDKEVLSTTHLHRSPLTVATILRVSSTSSTTKQYDPEDNFIIETMIEPTHEIEGQNDLASISEVNKFSDDNYSRSAISQAIEKPQRFINTDRVIRDLSPVMNVLDKTESKNFWDKLPKSEPLGEARTSPRWTQVSSSRQQMRKNLELGQERTLKKNPLSVSNSELVSTVLKDTLNRREIDSLYDAEFPAISRNDIMSLDNMKVKQSKEDYGSSSHAYPIAETVKQVSFATGNKHGVIYDHFEETCKTSRKVNELSQLSWTRSQNKMSKMSTELNSRNQGTSSETHVPENHVRLSGTAPSSKLPMTESRNVQENNTQKIVKKRKCVKVVRFSTCDVHGDTEYNRIGTKLQESFEGRDIGLGHSKLHLDSDNPNDTPECMSVESFVQEIDQMANQITGQIEIDPALDDAVATLAKVEIIVEANRQTFERLQQLQPSIAIAQLIPPDAGKSLAKALTRCRHYMQNSGYSNDATDTINKLLTSPVQDLKQLVERHKLALAARDKNRCAALRGRRQSKRSHQENSLNTRRVLTAEEFEVNQMQCFISNILKLTEKFEPKANGKESQRKSSVALNYLHNGAKNSTKKKRTIKDAIPAETNDTGSPEVAKITLKTHTSRVRQPLDVSEPNKAKEPIKTGSKKTVVFSEASSNPRIDSNQQKKQNRRHQRADKELETTQLSITRSTYLNKIPLTDSAKTLNKLFNEFREKRSKTFQHHYNVNDSTNKFRTVAGSHNATINQKPPVWKPGGNNLIQPSMSVIPNNQKIRPPSSSPVSKQKNTISEHTRDTKPHQRTKAIPDVFDDLSKILEKSVMRPYNVTSLAKIRTDPAREYHYGMLSLGRSKVQIAAEVDQARSRKPRSKSRTRTKTSHKVSRITATEIPLEYANDGSLTVTEKKISAVKELTLTKRASSSPKDIMKMLEELIKSSSNETSTYNANTVQVVGRCNVATKDISEVADRSVLLKTEVKSTNAIDLTSSSRSINRRTEESSPNRTILSKSIKQIVIKNENTAKTNNNGIRNDEDEASVQDTLTKPCGLHKELDSISALNTEEICTISRSNSEPTSNRSTEGRTAPSVSNVGCSAELSSHHSIGSFFSKYCQASLTSLTSHEISEDLISSQISDQRVTSCCEETKKDSNESFDTVEDRVTHENLAQQFHKDQGTSASSGSTHTKKFANRHARSLEMLKEILSDQGLDIHLLSRAENKLRGRCQHSSSKRRLTASRSLQGVNFTTSKFSGKPIDRVSLLDRNLSTTLCSKLATLSESESDIEHVEAATMTLANDSTVSTNDHSTFTEFDSYCSKEDKALSDKVITVEKAIQFEVTSKSDMCVGDGVICDTYAPFTTINQENRTEHFSAPYNSAATLRSSSPVHKSLLVDKRTSFECKLPDQILDAFRLAAVRATNFYAAINILRENMLSESITWSNSAVSPSFNEIPTDMRIPRPLTAAHESPSTEKMGSGHVRHLSQVCTSDSGIKLPIQSEESNTAPPERIIIPRIRAKVKDEANCIEPTKIIGKELPTEEVIGIYTRTAEESNRRITEDTLCSACKVDLSQPAGLPKPFSVRKNAFGTTVEKKTLNREHIIDPSAILTVENRSSRNTEIPRSAVFVPKESCQSPSLSQQSFGKGCITEKQIETLHFAGRQTVSVVGNTASAKLQDIIESNPRSFDVNFANYGSPKAEDNIRDPLVGSRIKTLLEENLQRFKIDYNPIIHEKVFTDFGDQFLTESSDEESFINKVVNRTITPTSCAKLDDRKIFSEVTNLLNCLISEIEENCGSSTMDKQHRLPRKSHSSRHRHLRKHERRLKSERTKRTVKHSILCGQYWNNLSGIVVPREHLLSLIYAAICSFVFCCLQLSIRCEV